jgi:hypothetical protein
LHKPGEIFIPEEFIELAPIIVMLESVAVDEYPVLAHGATVEKGRRSRTLPLHLSIECHSASLPGVQTLRYLYNYNRS